MDIIEFLQINKHRSEFHSDTYGCSSVGRALVSKTRCREFEPYHPCLWRCRVRIHTDQYLFGALVQLVRISPCHGGGHGFESRTHRTKYPYRNAKIAQLVEHDLAKVGVAGSSPVFRSTSYTLNEDVK